MSRLSRRSFLKSLGAASASIPFLPVLSTAAEGDEFPRRLIVFFSANGTVHENWRPSGGETDFTLSPILEPLAGHKDDIIIVDELVMESAKHGPGDDHQRGMGHVLTGTELLEGNEFPGCGGDCPGSGWGGGISVDQFIANEIGTSTRFPSLELGVQVQSNTVWSRMCYRGPNEPIPAEDDPWALAERVFGDFDADPFGLEAEKRRRRTVLQGLMDDTAALEGKVSRADAIKLEAHMDAFRELERRLDVSDPNTLGQYCEVPDPGEPIDVYANGNFPAVGRAQMDLLVMAMACDMTRVGSIQWSRAVSNTQFSWLDDPISEGHHDLSHEPDDNADAIEKLTRINIWYAQQFNYLLDRLDSIPEGEGTMLDNTAVVWVNELARGNRHSHDPQPVVIGGRGGGYFRTGRYIKTGGASHNDVLTSLCHQMGLDYVDTFGNPSYGSGPLVSLT